MSFKVVLLALALGSGPSYAQTSTVSTPAQTSPASQPLAEKHSLGVLYDLYKSRSQQMAIDNKMYTKGALTIHSPADVKVLTPNIKSLNLKDLLKKKGGVDGGGGDSIGLEFQLALSDATADYGQYASEPKPDFDWMEISQYGSSLHVVTVDETLVFENRNVIALNDYATKTIRIQRKMWNAITDVRIKTAVSLNMTLLMKKQKAFGIESVPNNMLVSTGLSGSGLIDGQVHAPADQERTNFNSIQCLYGYEQQKRIFELWKFDVLSCRGDLRLTSVHANRFEQVAERCLEYCKGDPSYVQLHDVCVDSAQTYFGLVKGFRRLTPKCVQP